MSKTKTRIVKFSRFDSGAVKQQFISHLTESRSRNKGGQRKDCRAGERVSQSLCELQIGYRIWRNGVDRAMKIRRLRAIQQNRAEIFKRYPAHVLIAGPDLTAHSEFER